MPAGVFLALGNDPIDAPGWQVERCARSVHGLIAGLEWARTRHPKLIVCWDSCLRPPSQTLATEFLASRADVWHGGLHLGHGNAPDLLTAVVPTTWVSLAMSPALECSSWQLPFHAALIRGEVIDQAPAGVDPAFVGLEGAGLDWGLRLMRAGVVMRHHPDVLGRTREGITQALPIEDQVRLIVNSFGQKWALWGVVRRTRPGQGLGRALRSALAAPGAASLPSHRYLQPQRKKPIPEIEQVSVIIPTVDRPKQLATLLDQLGRQTRGPDEVVVADQSGGSPGGGSAQRTDGLAPTVLRLSQRGQSGARNSAINATTGDLVMLLDDDEEVPSDLIERHLEVLAYTGADGLAGGVDVPGQPGDDPTRMRIAETFPGGHSSVRRAALQQSGLFDPVFDRGPRADADIGMRLALSGALILYVPSIRIIHHHAMHGGLRAIGARRVTRASSRSSLTQRNIPAVTQLYLGLRYWDAREVRESILLGLVSGFGHEGSPRQSVGRAAVQLVLLPDSIRKVRSHLSAAQELIRCRPPIPELSAV